MCFPYAHNEFSLRLYRIIDGKEYDGDVKAKQEAQEQYTQAVSRGQSAGIVRYVSRSASYQVVYR